MAFGIVLAQLLNMFLILMFIAVPVAFVVWAVTNRGKQTPTENKLLLQKRDDSYVRVRLDDVAKIDIVDEHEAVIHLADEQKVSVRPDEARRVIRKLR